MELEERFEMLEQKMIDHVEHCDAQFQQGSERFETIMGTQQEILGELRSNKIAVKGVHDEIVQVKEDTEDVVQLHRDFQGAARIGGTVQKLGTFLLKWGIIGSGLYAVLQWFIKQLENI